MDIFIGESEEASSKSLLHEVKSLIHALMQLFSVKITHVRLMFLKDLLSTLQTKVLGTFI